MNKVIRQGGQAAVQDEVIKLSRLTNTFTAIMSMLCSFQSVMQVVLNYTEVFELLYGVSFPEARIKDIVDDMMGSRYLPKQLCSSYIR